VAVKYKALLNCSVGSALYQFTLSVGAIAFGLWEGLEPLGTYLLFLGNVLLVAIFLYFLMRRGYWGYLIFFIVQTLHLLLVTIESPTELHGYNILNFVLSLLGFVGMVLNRQGKMQESLARQ